MKQQVIKGWVPEDENETATARFILEGNFPYPTRAEARMHDTSLMRRTKITITVEHQE